MIQSLFTTFLPDHSSVDGSTADSHDGGGHTESSSSSQTEKDPSSQSAKKLHNDVLEHRLAEMESREEILDHLRAIHRDQLWKILGYKSLGAFCKKELGYTAREARELSVALGAVLISSKLSSNDPEVQARIDALRKWRRMTAASENVAAYRIFTNRTLMLVAKKNPGTLKELSEISGFGIRRLDAFGADLVTYLRTVGSSIADQSNLRSNHQPSLPSVEA